MPMTNIVAAVLVSIVTNTTESIYTPPVQYYGCLVYGCQQDHYKEAQDAANANRVKTITTTAKKVSKLSFEWNGTREIVSEEILWSTNHVLKLEWK
jgi:hypothetical protein